MTLARQMYPENPQHMMRHFKNATSKPHGYLDVGFKPTTIDSLRLRTDVLNLIRRQESEEKIQHTQYYKTTNSFNNQSDLEDMPSCDDCGLLFDNMNDV